MAEKRKRKNSSIISVKSISAAVVFIVMAISLSVRWSGTGRDPVPIEEPFEMEVLNGTGEPGIAKMITRQLRIIGFDVVLEGNASRFDFRESLLVDHRNNPCLMRKLSGIIGCKRILKQYKDYSEVDVTLIIGWDRDRLKISVDQ